MKKILFSLLVFVPLLSQAQMDTLFMGYRVPNYYYWGDWWVDYIYAHTTPEYWEENLYASASPVNHATEIARCFYSLDTMKIIGVAASVEVGITPDNILPIKDTTILPEYFRIFYHNGPTDAESPILAAVRYDTCTPRYMTYIGGQYKPLVETYFDSPVYMVDTFYVSRTSNNNYQIRDTVIINITPNGDTIDNWYGYYAHPYTALNSCVHKKNPKFFEHYPFGRNLYRYHVINEVNPISYPIGYPYPMCTDTNVWCECLDWTIGNTIGYAYIFPIFDTTYFVDTTTVSWCMAPNNLRAPAPDAESTVLLWNSTNGSEWDVSLCKECTEPDSGDITHYTTTFASLTGLEAGATYRAWVRAYCNESDTSYWSEELQFTVPMPADTGGTGDTNITEQVFNVDDAYFMLTPNPASERVNAFSSFQIRELDIYTMSGTLVRHESPRALSVNVDISDLPRGLYIVRATTAHGMAYARLVKL